MPTARIAPLMVLFACSVLAAQQSVPPRADATAQITPGTEFPVAVKHTIEANKAHNGERIEFTTMESVLAGHQLVIPANATIVGHVLDAKPARSGSQSELKFTVDEIHWKNGTAALGAIISGVRRRQIVTRWSSLLQPTFLEGTSIAALSIPVPISRLSSAHNVVLRSGTLLMLKQVAAPGAVAEKE